VWVVPVLIWLVWAPDRPAFGRLWAAAGAALFWWAPIWTVPNSSNRELSEHGWQLLWGNSFALAMVVFMVGITSMLWMRRPGSTGADRAWPDLAGEVGDPAPVPGGFQTALLARTSSRRGRGRTGGEGADPRRQ
jgi:hypothetical protein